MGLKGLGVRPLSHDIMGLKGGGLGRCRVPTFFLS